QGSSLGRLGSLVFMFCILLLGVPFGSEVSGHACAPDKIIALHNILLFPPSRFKSFLHFFVACVPQFFLKTLFFRPR
ncbi:MAG: hypothetical protein IIT59_05365, partial [Rhodocyclaceae bacterium]|nr:hypothetical protein [Rhodocyclaceae bacterium]